MAQNILSQSDSRIVWSWISLEGINQYLRFFCLELVIKGRQHLGVPFLVGFGQLCLFSSQISGILDHQSIPLDRTIWNLSFFACRWSSKEVNMLDYHLCWVSPSVRIAQSDCRILWSLISLEAINWYQNSSTLWSFFYNSRSSKSKKYFLLFQSRSFARVWNTLLWARFISRRNFLKPTCHSFPRIS